jgi:polysaccharide biosynthesis protein PslH
MHILFVCRFLPHSLARDSGRLDTYHYIKSLSEQHTVSLIAFVTPEDRSGIAEMEAICAKVIAVPFDRMGLWPRLSRAWWRLLQPQVYGRNLSDPYRRALQSYVATTECDVAVVHGMMAEYGRYLAHIPAVLDEVDLFFMVAHQLFRRTRNPLARRWARFDWLRTMAREVDHLNDYAGVFVRSVKDEMIVRDLVPGQNLAVLPPWFEGLEELQMIPVQRPFNNNLLFVGAMNIPPNIEAVTFFAQQVLPKIRRLVPDAQLHIVGGNPDPAVQKLAAEPGVTVTGEVPALAPYYADCAVAITPLFVGGGIIVKTLNGLASGRPVVTTQVGNSGTGAINGRDLLIVPPDPDIMANTVTQLLTNQQQWQQLAEQGRHFIQAHYNWSEIIKNLTDFLHQIAFGEGSPPVKR